MEEITCANLLSQEAKRDPIAFSRGLHEQGSLIYLESILDLGGGWIITAYDAASALLKDLRLTKDPLKISEASSSEQLPTLSKMLSMRQDMLVTHPPDHTHLRHLVSKAFTPRTVEQLRSHIQQIA